MAYTFNACVCCYTAIDVKNILVCAKSSGTCLCIEEEFCCAAGAASKGLGIDMKADGAFCKLMLPCCSIALKKEIKVCTAAAAQCLCFKQATSLPLSDDYVGKPMCTVCFISVLPEVGVFKEAPTCAALER
mmetsp:Transcript_25908/g.81132  ORF Transcript_25908/g.81132 Transcript_25908/m.81132 type:complete len:131 (-) Transcript_25908:163-555(-)|eukprot:CAMPEP_0118881194 /NCGR_PEP_ID=MMETSP1163-20130328/20688_1 /TAXON_ID=124430 /ORGANISM="Phaeomonas parva, Strain CCMP2877" /LENGTH=130 /DNA_ID=CAMNT_0006817891 /DNA_START=204 /DNA_END=596 /DNA_ORIENTATION=-